MDNLYSAESPIFSSGIVFGVGTALWVTFKLLEYHLITLVCRSLIVALAILFLCSKLPVHIPEIEAPGEGVLKVSFALSFDINQAYTFLREIATGNDVRKFLRVTARLWIVSVLGSRFNLLTLLYLLYLSVSLFTMPLLYEKYGDQVGSFAKAMAEIKKLYAEFDAKVLSRMPLGRLKKD